MAKENTSRYYTEESTTRLVALQVVIILLLALSNKWTFLVYILTVDFALRAFTYIRSPLAYTAMAGSKILGIKNRPIWAAPKKFAALIGTLFSLAISILLFLDLETAAYVAGGILAFFALLEGVFNVCVGCYLYNWAVVPLINSKSRREERREKTGRVS